MSTQSSAAPPQQPFVVVAAIDDSTLGDRVAAVAGNEARLVAGARLHIVHVVELPVADPLVPEGRAVNETRARLESGRDLVARLVDEASARGLAHVFGHVVGGEIWRGILSAAAHVSADLIVVGTHGRKGMQRFLLGSVAETIVHKASCPVLVVRPKEWSRRDYPEIEPPCPDCVAAQEASGGAVLWCERHSQRHARAHVYSEFPDSFGQGSMLIRPQ